MKKKKLERKLEEVLYKVVDECLHNRNVDYNYPKLVKKAKKKIIKVVDDLKEK